MRLPCFAVAALALSMPGAALADWRDGSAEAHDYMRDYARCMVLAHRRSALELVTSTVDASEFDQRFPMLVSRDVIGLIPHCQPPLQIRNGIKVNFDGEPLRLALAEALIARYWQRGGPVALTDVAPLAPLEVEPKERFDARLASIRIEARRAELKAAYDKSVAMAWLARYGECVVRHDPEKSRFWILSKRGGPDESAAVSSLGSAFGACLAESERLNFNRDILRGTIAVSYVRLAAAQSSHDGGSR